MCNPAIIFWVGTAISAAGAIQQGMVAKETGKANQRIGKIMADDARARGDADAAAHKRKVAAFKGEQIAAFGASGAEIESGSSLEISADTAQIGELEVLRIRNNAEREAFGLEASGNIARAQGDAAFTSSLFSAVGTVASGVSTKWAQFKVDNPDGSGLSFLGFGNGGGSELAGNPNRFTS